MMADGVGNPLIRADVAVSGERIAEVGDVTESARQTVDADGLVLGARHRRRAHPLRRPAHLGEPGDALAGARRHHCRDGQLRLQHRALPARAARADGPQPGRGGGHVHRRAGGGHRLGLRELPRVSGAAPAQGVLSQRRRLRRPFGGAHHRAGGRGLGADGARGRDRRHARHRQGGDGGRRDRLRHLDLHQPQRRRRRADAVAAARTTTSCARSSACSASSSAASSSSQSVLP